MKNILLILTIIIIFTISFTGCPTTIEEKDKESLPVLFSMTGTFDGGVADGNIVSWTIYQNGTFAGAWSVTSGPTTVSLNTSGTYTLVGTSISMTGSGTAVAGSDTSSYTFTASGTVSGANASGTFDIQFSNPDFDDDSGSWTSGTVTPPYIP